MRMCVLPQVQTCVFMRAHICMCAFLSTCMCTLAYLHTSNKSIPAGREELPRQAGQSIQRLPLVLHPISPSLPPPNPKDHAHKHHASKSYLSSPSRLNFPTPSCTCCVTCFQAHARAAHRITPSCQLTLLSTASVSCSHRTRFTSLPVRALMVSAFAQLRSTACDHARVYVRVQGLGVGGWS